jgi:predicted small metal-binding protein
VEIFRCGDVVSNCRATFTGSEQEILSHVGEPARAANGLAELTPRARRRDPSSMRPVLV